MSISVALLSSIGSTDFIDSFKHRHHDLLVELRTLSEIHFTIEIIHLKYFRSSLRRKTDKLRRIDLGEIILIEELSHSFFCKRSYFECLHISWMSEHNHFVIVDSLSVSVDLVFRYIYRTWIDDFSEHIHAALLDFKTEFPFRHFRYSSCRRQNSPH